MEEEEGENVLFLCESNCCYRPGSNTRRGNETTQVSRLPSVTVLKVRCTHKDVKGLQDAI